MFEDARLPPSLAVAAPLLRISHAARTADGGLSICGHVHRITRAGARTASSTCRR